MPDINLGIEQFKLLLKDLNMQKQILQAEMKTVEAEKSVAKLEAASLSKQVEKLKDTISDTIHRFKENHSQEQESYKKKRFTRSVI